MNKNQPVAIVVGGGLAGLSCAMKLAEAGFFVNIVSVTKVKRSHSVCAQGGINAALNLKGEDDSPFIHAYETIKGGDFLADQPPVLEMTMAGPSIIYMMERFGVPFNRTPEGNLDVRRFGGTFYKRTVFCGASTGQQLLYALDEQVRKYEVAGLVKKFEHHEFMRLVRDDEGKACGIVMMDLMTMKLETLKADAVIFGTGGPGLIFKQSTNSTFCTGAANGRLFEQGMWYANGEFIQIHPTAIPAKDKLRLISESTRGEGARMWVYGDETKKIKDEKGIFIPCGQTGKPWYFLEEMYQKLGNLVPRDIASRIVLEVCQLGLGIDGKDQVYLDMSHLDIEKQKKVESVLEIYRKFTGDDPKKVPMKIFPAVHYSMGGAWVDWPEADAPDRETRFRQMTNIPGCFQVGESEFQYHGANRLGANSLLSCIFGGLTAGIEVPRYVEIQKERAHEKSEGFFKQALAKEEMIKKDLLQRSGKENVHALHDELAAVMVQNMTVKRSNLDLSKTIEKIKEIRERYKHISLDDKGEWMNQTYAFANQFRSMIELALAMTKSALLRNESRGAHAKVDFPERNDKEWLKTTIASYAEDEPVISYKPVNTCHVDPVARDYSKAQKGTPEFKNVPKNIKLPV